MKNRRFQENRDAPNSVAPSIAGSYYMRGMDYWTRAKAQMVGTLLRPAAHLVMWMCWTLLRTFSTSQWVWKSWRAEFSLLLEAVMLWTIVTILCSRFDIGSRKKSWILMYVCECCCPTHKIYGWHAHHLSTWLFRNRILQYMSYLGGKCQRIRKICDWSVNDCQALWTNMADSIPSAMGRVVHQWR